MAALNYVDDDGLPNWHQSWNGIAPEPVFWAPETEFGAPITGQVPIGFQPPTRITNWADEAEEFRPKELL